jgi:hypothetical protein
MTADTIASTSTATTSERAVTAVQAAINAGSDDSGGGVCLTKQIETRETATHDNIDIDLRGPSTSQQQHVGEGVDVDNNNKEDELERIENQLKTFPVWIRNQEFCVEALQVVRKWHATFDAATWKRIRKRVAKELNEVEPCIRYTRQLVSQYYNSSSSSSEDFDSSKQDKDSIIVKACKPKLTIVDVCSGFGICSMFLSELLPKDSVDKILLVDKLFPMKGHDAKHMFINHLLPPQSEAYPIPLQFRKVDMKATRQRNQLKTYIVDRAPGPVLLLGVHLCKALSVHCIKLYQAAEDKVAAMVLKPCCLPGKQMVRRKIPIVWEFNNGFCFSPGDLYHYTTNMSFQSSEAGNGGGRPRRERRPKKKSSRTKEENVSAPKNADKNATENQTIEVEASPEETNNPPVEEAGDDTNDNDSIASSVASCDVEAGVEIDIDVSDEEQEEEPINAATKTVDVDSQSVTKQITMDSRDGYVHKKPPRVATGPVNPHGDKNYTNARFSKWIDNLSHACQPSSAAQPQQDGHGGANDEALTLTSKNVLDCGSNKDKQDNCSTRNTSIIRDEKVWVEKIDITHHHFQNSYIFCERPALLM